MIYLPIEVYVREAAFMTHLATRLADCNVPILIGDQRVLQSSVLRDKFSSIYFEKSLDKSKKILFKKLPKEIKLVAHDVEFTGVYRGREYIENRFSEEGCNRANLVIFHDDFEANAVKKIRNISNEFWVRGSWYFESVVSVPEKNKLEIEQVKKKYGDNFIFVPSNFGGFFRREGIGNFNKWIENFYESNNYKNEFKEKIIEREKERLIFAEAISKIAVRYPDRIIILRPHPTEDDKAWHIFPFPENVLISSEYTTAIMTAACSKVIHNCCTTVIDANLLGRTQYVFKISKSQNLWPFWDYIDYLIDLQKPFNGLLPENNELKKLRIPTNEVSKALISWVNKELSKREKRQSLAKPLVTAITKGLTINDTFKYSIKNNYELTKNLRDELSNHKIYNLYRCVLIN
jgi:surface carbohydrate biosynthesis protein